MTSHRRFRHDALLKLGGEIFRRGGSEAGEADLVIGHLVPGDPERMAREERLRDGIAVDATTWEEILTAAEQIGLSRADAEKLAR